MPDLVFQVEGAEVAKFAASPHINFKLRITNSHPGETIHSVALRGQVQLEVTQRRYTSEEQKKLRDLFGEPERWSQTLKSLLWTHVQVNASSFQSTTVIDVPVPCTFDFNVGATKYFYGLNDGEVPLCFLFSGNIYYSHDSNSALQIAPIPWDKEARFRLPIKLWREMMDTYYPQTAWLCLRRDVFERCYEYKVRHGLPTWEQTLERMLDAEEVVHP
jgi:hypothetical protein